MGKIDRQNKPCVFRKEEVLLFASKCRSRRMNYPKLPNTSSFAHSSVVSKGTNEKRQKGSAIPNSKNTTYQIDTKHGPSNKIMRSGVYFNKREIFNTIHPTQLKYNMLHVTKVLNLPVGMPLAKPPHLGVINHGLLPRISKTVADKPLLRKIDASQSKKEPSFVQNRAKREKGSIEDEKPEYKHSKCIRVVDSASISTSASGNKLSSEEWFSLEAAITISSLEVSVPKNEEKEKIKRAPSPEPSAQAMPPPPFLFSQGTFSRVLLPPGWKS